MSSKQESETEWTIFRVKDTRAHFVGTVEAPNEETAITRAMEVFNINERQSVLSIRRPRAR
jgi:1,2-phenylacetyl-CoA epoxidase PaaB subunit